MVSFTIAKTQNSCRHIIRQKKPKMASGAKLFTAIGKINVRSDAKIQWVKLPRACPFAQCWSGNISEIRTQMTAPCPIAWAAMNAKMHPGTSQTAETKYKIPIQSKVRLRPNRSVGSWPIIDPSTVPQSAELIARPCSKSERFQSDWMVFSAPEITTVSKPNRNPAKAEVNDQRKSRFEAFTEGPSRTEERNSRLVSQQVSLSMSFQAQSVLSQNRAIAPV